MEKARVLVVGAGGIGCELLKTLVLSGFQTIEVVDLDTIDLSNLNRQFLFRRKHIGQSKAKIAAEAVRAMQPNLKITAHHENIITNSARFDLDWFRSFDIVMNALDNLEARRYVNQMCLAARVPLVESGTAGLLGQATVHVGGVTECFDCTPKATPKVFPVCTIRSTPSQPIHCIVWAKSFLFVQLFGKTVNDEIAEEQPGSSSDDDGNIQELENLKRETQALQALRDLAGKDTYAKAVFDKVFDTDIQRLRSNEDLWKQRKAPIALHFQTLSKQERKEQRNEEDVIGRDQNVWTLAQSFRVFLSSTEKLGRRLADGQDLEFDKDDDVAMDFVAAAANLRAHLFSIPMKSRFTIKEMAGNIIPAIATTNAVIAGFIVLLGMKVLAGNASECSTTYLSYSSDNRRLHNERMVAPNPQCNICSQMYCCIQADVSKVTLGDFLKTIVHQEDTGMGFQGEVTILRNGDLLYDPDFDDNVERSFEDLKVLHGTQLTVLEEDNPAGPDHVPVVFYVSHVANHKGITSLEPLTNIPEKSVPLKQQEEKEEPQQPQPTESPSRKRKLDSPNSLEDKRKVAKVVELEEDQDLVLIE